MKRIYLLFTLFILVCAGARAENYNQTYSRTLKDFAIEETENGKKVFFILDDGTVLTSIVKFFEEYKLYSLPNLLNHHVTLLTSAHYVGFILGIESLDKHVTKLTFRVTVSKETYDNALTIQAIQSEKHWFSTKTYLILSNGSKWEIHPNFYKFLVYYHVGDHVLLTKGYEQENNFHALINLDLSDTYFECLGNISGVGINLLIVELAE